MITLYFGKTESGKSFLAEKLTKMAQKQIVYDYAKCFSGGKIVIFNSENEFKRNFRQLIKWARVRQKYKIIFRWGSLMDDTKALDLISIFAFTLGMTYGTRKLLGTDRIRFIIDEADKVTRNNPTPKEKSKPGAYLAVTKGRHENLDVHAICQDPLTLPTYFRRNASEIFTFRLEKNSYFDEKLKNPHCQRVETLEKYHYIHWKDNGEVRYFNNKGKEVKR